MRRLRDGQPATWAEPCSPDGLFLPRETNAKLRAFVRADGYEALRDPEIDASIRPFRFLARPEVTELVLRHDPRGGSS